MTRRFGRILMTVLLAASSADAARAQVLPAIIQAPLSQLLSPFAPAQPAAPPPVARQILPGVKPSAVAPTAPSAQPAAPLAALKLDATSMPLGGMLKSPEVWAAYKNRFITERGRVVDTANGQISHSEGQGYGMLLAVAAKDRNAFERIWGWTRANLMVRDDQLLAWRWEPNNRPAIADVNNASDGDILVAWALTEAADFWNDLSYRIAARRIAVEVGRKVVINKTRYGALLLPAVSGFATEDRPDGPVVNLSYWVFPAFSRLPLVAPEVDWSGISQSGLDLIKGARFGVSGLPTEWVSARNDQLKPADNFPQVFSYNSIRIPLYMAWAGIGEREHYAPFAAQWGGQGAVQMASVDTATGRKGQAMSESGYASVAALTLCVVSQTPMPRDFRAPRSADNYYPATLNLMALIAAEMRYSSCLRS